MKKILKYQERKSYEFIYIPQTKTLLIYKMQ